MWGSYPQAGNRVPVYATLYEWHEHPCWRPIIKGVLALLTIKPGAATEILRLVRIHQVMQRLLKKNFYQLFMCLGAGLSALNYQHVPDIVGRYQCASRNYNFNQFQFYTDKMVEGSEAVDNPGDQPGK